MDDGWIASLLDAQESPSTLIHLALLNFEGYPQGTAFLRSMERFTSIRTLHLSEDADGSEESYESSTKLYCLPFWLSSLPVRKTVEELVIHVNDLQHDSAVISSLDEIISDKDTMPRLKRVVVRINLSEMELKPMVKEEMENWLSTAQSGELIETRYFYGEREVDV
ncbi:hypothetical protein DL96DRAFT_1561588 [Flagelloscypha sp. PMI_526]|nr:hypothetical protein DL96DRAFT_1561588 [Flagelloscypha sp. PMI_526]